MQVAYFFCIFLFILYKIQTDKIGISKQFEMYVLYSQPVYFITWQTLVILCVRELSDSCRTTTLQTLNICCTSIAAHCHKILFHLQ